MNARRSVIAVAFVLALFTSFVVQAASTTSAQVTDPFSLSLTTISTPTNLGTASSSVSANAGAPSLLQTLKAEVVSLESELANLRADLTAQPSSPTASTTPSAFVFTRPLGLGSTGSDVAALQLFLTTNGVFTGPISGYFGPLTQAAVAAFQTNNGLQAVGSVGPRTRALLNSSPIHGNSASAAASTTQSSGPQSSTATSSQTVIPLPQLGISLSFGGGGEGGGGGSPSSAASATDTTPPTVSLSSPAASSTISGAVVLTATASDNVGVANVQFKIDGTAIGSPITSAPYAFTWNSTSVLDGYHTIAAVAEDAANNYATSSVGIAVENTAVSITSISSGTPTTTAATITWMTNQAASSTVLYGTTTPYSLATSSVAFVTSHSITLTGLSSGTVYHFQVQATNAAGSYATSTDQTFTSAYAGAFAALELAKTRRVDFAYVSDSNGQYNGWGWSAGFTVALGNKYGLYASPVYPLESSGTGISVAGAPSFAAITPVTGSTTGAPSAQAPYALPYASYLFQATSSIGGQNGIYLSVAPTDANGNAFNGFSSAANLRFWMAYGTFASGGGSFKPAARYDASPYSTLVTGSTINAETGTDGEGITSLSLSATTRAHDVSFRWQLPGGTASVASTTELWQRLENQDATAGISVTQLYAVAGMDLYDQATTFEGYTQAQWTNYFNAVTYLQAQDGQSPTLVVFINSGDNDINDNRTSIGPIGGLANNTAAGYADNLAEVVNLITTAWTNAGYQIGNNGSPGLYFLIVPSHVYGSSDNSTLIAMRAAAASYVAQHPNNMSFVNLATLVPYSELIANGGYSVAPHLTNQAYQYIATKLVNTFLPN